MRIDMVLQIIAGVGILIYGIMLMGESLQVIAGDRMRTLTGKLTGTPIKGFLVGTIVTGILQSSGATTVMVVSFVDVGVMTLKQAIGVILGANIGTTVTAQLIAFNMTNVAYICTGLGTALIVVSKTKRIKQLGACIVGFSLLFIGINMMKWPLAVLSERPEIMAAFSQHKLYAFLFGLLITLVVQSSSATVGLTMAVAAQGLISLDVAIVICLGENIGSTVTAVIVALSSNRAAKQTAAAHVLVKIFGTIVILAILPLYVKLIEYTSSDIARQVANAHTVFNVIVAVMFLPFVSPYAKFLQKIIPNDGVVATTGSIYLNKALTSVSPAAAVSSVRKEMQRLGGITLQMINDGKSLFMTHDEKLIEKITSAEKTVNLITDEIMEYSSEVGQSDLSADLSTILNACTSGVSDMERIGDHATNLVEIYGFLRDHSLKFSPKAEQECRAIFDVVISALSCSIQALEEDNPALAHRTTELEDRVDYMERTLRAQHIARLNAGACSPSVGIAFIDILSNLERVGDHAQNLAMVVFDVERAHNSFRGAKS